MRIVALLSWYAEAPALLSAAVAALGRIPVDHLVAVDGAYELFPSGKPRSDPAEVAAIHEAAAAAGFGVTLHQPAQTWTGNEVAKRNCAVRLAEELTGPDDWYLVLDADHVVVACDAALRQRLAGTGRAVATYALVQPPLPAELLSSVQRATIEAHADQWPAEGALALRMLYRARRGIVYGPEHWTVTAGPIRLWGPGPLAEAEDLTSLLRMEHRCLSRTDEQLGAALEYYRVRDARAAEGRSAAQARRRRGHSSAGEVQPPAALPAPPPIVPALTSTLEPLAPGAQSWHDLPISAGVSPLFTAARGSRLWQDERSLIDLYCGSGTIILGHADPRQVAAVTAALASGASVSLRHPLEPALARRLVELVGGDRHVAFFKTGSEAVHAALSTAARATSRRRILTTGYHGWLAPLGGGPFGGAGCEVRRLSWSSPSLLAEVAELSAGAACLVIVPTPDMPAAGEVRAIVAAARRGGALIVADEVKSAFRRAYPTVAQAELGIEPDLQILSKALANGFALAALLGTTELMGSSERFDVFSTYASEILSFAAAHACLDALADEALERFRESSTALWDALAAVGAPYGVRVVGVPTFFRLALPPTLGADELCAAMYERGILFHPLDEVLVSAAHSTDDVDEVCAGLAGALSELAA